MVSQFRTYESAICFAQICRKLILDSDLKDQLNRESASIALNLAEGSAANTQKERHRFYIIALRSFRECEAIIRIANIKNENLDEIVNKLGSQLYNLRKATARATSQDPGA